MTTPITIQDLKDKQAEILTKQVLLAQAQQTAGAAINAAQSAVATARNEFAVMQAQKQLDDLNAQNLG